MGAGVCLRDAVAHEPQSPALDKGPQVAGRQLQHVERPLRPAGRPVQEVLQQPVLVLVGADPRPVMEDVVAEVCPAALHRTGHELWDTASRPEQRCSMWSACWDPVDAKSSRCCISQSVLLSRRIPALCTGTSIPFLVAGMRAPMLQCAAAKYRSSFNGACHGSADMVLFSTTCGPSAYPSMAQADGPLAGGRSQDAR